MKHLETRGFHFYEEGKKWVARGVTYGTFRAGADGTPYPEPARIRDDFSAMAAMGINSIRLYSMPTETLASIAAEYGLRLLIDVPWPKHIDVYDDPKLRKMCIGMVKDQVSKVSHWPNLLGVFLGNEIPPDLIRWKGPERVTNFLRELYDLAKSIAPALPIGYANYPSTEYLQTDFFDFMGFNVYLHDGATFRDYLIRLRLLYPELPIILSEIGMDTQRHSEDEQAGFLAGHLRIAYETGLAGAFVFAWTDEWHTGNFDIEDWSFGLVDAQRRPKKAQMLVESVFQNVPRTGELAPWPPLSIVVATYNGGRTLRGCLDSLMNVNYPDYEVIVVDDGSTDNTAAILSDFPNLRVLRQPNSGLSAARNSGIAAATGEIVAFMDSDCIADPDWPHHLVYGMSQGGFGGLGGPNLTPPEPGRWPRCVALAPGHATHVLLNQHEAEHVPGCNMAFRRDLLLRIGGFDPVYRKAGDDVDVIWRLQDMGFRVGFSTSAFVWHFRRTSLKAYLKQQIGYGEAEALLLWKHPHRFNDRGQSLWRGVIYPNQHGAMALRRPVIHFGIFGSGAYQCLYARAVGPLAYLLTSLEWWVICLVLLLGGMFAREALFLGLAGIVISSANSGLFAWRQWSRGRRLPLTDLPLIWVLWVIQPIVRAGARNWFRWRSQSPTAEFETARGIADNRSREESSQDGPVRQYWSEQAPERVELLQQLTSQMNALRWLYTPNTGWEPWDVTVVLSQWFKLLITSAEENHGQRKRLVRFRYQLRPSSLFFLMTVAAFLVCGAIASENTILARLIMLVFLFIAWLFCRQAIRAGRLVEQLVDQLMKKSGFIAMSAFKPKEQRHERGAFVETSPEKNAQQESRS